MIACLMLYRARAFLIKFEICMHLCGAGYSLMLDWDKYIRSQMDMIGQMQAMACQGRRTWKEEGHQLDGGNVIGYIKDVGIN